MTGIKPFAFSKKFSPKSYQEAKYASRYLTVIFQPVSGYRKTYAHRDYYDEPKSITGQSEYWLKISPKMIFNDGIIFYESNNITFTIPEQCNEKKECSVKTRVRCSDRNCNASIYALKSNDYGREYPSRNRGRSRGRGTWDSSAIDEFMRGLD